MNTSTLPTDYLTGYFAGLLSDQLDGRLVTAADPDWDESRTAWQLGVDQRPVAVVRARSAADVVATVRAAVAAGVRVAPQATGHNALPLVTGTTAVWGNEVFAELPTAAGTLAIADTRTVPLFGDGAAESGANRSVIIEYLVDDVDATYEKLRGVVDDVVTEPTTMPWGNRSFLFRDPDGNLVNLFTPVTPQARQKFGR